MRTYWALILCLLSLAAFRAAADTPQTNCLTPPPGLIAWWKGEGNTHDELSQSDATAYSNLAYSTGVVGQAMELDGASSYLKVPANTNLAAGFADGLSIEGWICPNATAKSQAIVDWDRNSVYGAHLWFAQGGALNNTLYANLVDQSQNDHIFSSTAALVATNTFQHIALTYSKASGIACFYTNGTLAAQQFLGTFVIETSYDLYIGLRPTASDSYFSGLIDELSLYSRALDSNEISAIYTASAAGKCSTSTPVTIVRQPENLTAYQNDPALFSVLASGSWPISYQWYFEDLPIPNATNSGLRLDSVQTNQAGTYYVQITNTAGQVRSSNVLLTVALSDECLPVPSGLRYWWKAEGNLHEEFGQDTALAIGNLTYSAGMVGSSFWFGSNHPYIKCPTGTNLDIGKDGSFTLEGWIAPNATASSQAIAEWNTGTVDWAGSSYGVHLWLAREGGHNNALYANLMDKYTNTHDFYSSSEIIVTNAFQHIALTYDKTLGFACFYVNGSLATQTFLGHFDPQTAYNFYLGARPNLSDGYYQGAIDEISLYNRALSASEIHSIYGAKHEGKCSPFTVPTITQQPTSVTTHQGLSAHFSAIASSTAPIAYQWYFQGISITNATNDSLVLDNLQTEQSGAYYVTASNTFGQTVSSNAWLTVLQTGSCISAPQGLMAWWRAEGTPEDELSTNTATILGSLTYAQGAVDHGFAFDATHPYLKVAANSRLDVGSQNGFSIEGWIAPTSTSSSQAIVEWNSGSQYGVHLWLTQGSYNNALYANLVDKDLNSHTFSTLAGAITNNQFQHIALTYDKTSGTAAIYINGTIVAQSQLGSFTPLTTYDLYFGARPSLSQNRYEGLMDEISLYNRALSPSEINQICQSSLYGKCYPVAPQIDRQPANQATLQDHPAHFSLAASGSRPLSYQWYYNGTPIAGATNAALLLNSVTLDKSGFYSATVSNAAGTAVTSNAELIVVSTDTCHPASPSLVGFWQAEDDVTDTAGIADGTPGGKLAYSHGQVGDAFIFNGSDAFVKIPAAAQINVGCSTGLTIEAWIAPANNSTAQPLFEWNNGNAYGLHVWLTPASGGMQLYANLVDQKGYYHTIYGSGNTLSNGGFQHVALTYDTNLGTACFYLNGELTTQESLGSFIPQTIFDLYLGVRPSENLFFSGLMDEVSLYNQALTAEEIRLIAKANVAGKCPLTNSPAIQTSPTNESVNAGDTVSFNVTVLGRPPFSYQWFRNFSPLTDNLLISGSQTPVLLLSNVTALTTSGDYFIVVSNACGAATSSVARLAVNDPYIVAQPTNLTLNPGDSGYLTVSVNGSEPLFYQWLKDEIALLGETGSALALTNAQGANSGYYAVRVSNQHGAVTSSIATVIVNLAHADSFEPEPDDWVYSLVPDLDGTILAAGDFKSIAGMSCSNLARLSSSGEFVSKLETKTEGTTQCVCQQDDGKILVAGFYWSPESDDVAFLHRINADGTRDTAFCRNATNDLIYLQGPLAMALQKDGKILLAGYFNIHSHQEPNRLLRFNTDGTLDQTFLPNLDSDVYTLAIQGDGKVLVGGAFTQIGGSPWPHLARLDTNGILDTSFHPQCMTSVYSIAVQPNGKILVGGTSTSTGQYSPTNYDGLARFNADGTLDTTFRLQPWDYVYSMSLQANGSLIIAANDYHWDPSQGRNTVYLLTPDGKKDLRFYPGTEGNAYGVSLQNNGAILVSGYLSGLNGQFRHHAGRLTNPDAAFHKLIALSSSLLWFQGGSYPQCSRTKFLFSKNGTNWTELGEGVPVDSGWQLTNITLLSKGYIRAKGLVTGSYVNGSSWYVQDTIRLDPTSARPKIVLASPGSGLRITNATLIAFGQASAATELAGVWYSLNGSDWTQASGSTNWTATLSLLPGLNTLKAFAIDTNGLASLPASVACTYVQTATLTLATNGKGAIMPNYTGKALEVGQTYSLTVKPASGWISAGWSGSLTTNSATLTFVMQTNLVLQANFVTNPYPALAGSYSGLFSDLDGLAPESSGSLSLTAARSGSFSGTLHLGLSRCSFSGKFDASGAASCRVSRGKTSALSLALQLDAAGLSGSIDSGAWTAEISAVRCQASAAAQAGQYTLIFPGSYAPTTEPCGHGYGTVTVDAAGRISLAASLADSTKATQSAQLTRTGLWPLYLPLYNGSGMLLSWLTFSNGITGEVAWYKPSLAQEKYFTNGFSLQTAAWGSRYQAPAWKHRILNFTNGTLLLKAATADAATQSIALDSQNHLAFPTWKRGSLTFKTATGEFSGSVYEPQFGRTLPVQGVVLQNSAAACGYFLTRTNHGGIVFGAPDKVPTTPSGWRK
jgi:uncharacterized delta-60 repeat protein